MHRHSYRTEIVIPPDRTVLLHLPGYLPEGRAVVVVQADEILSEVSTDAEPDREDIEWWDEFDDEPSPAS